MYEITLQIVTVPLIELPEDILGGIADGLEQDGDRELAPPVYADVEYVLGIELQIDP